MRGDRVIVRSAPAPAVDLYGALAVLRTFRGKLTYAIEVTGSPAQLNLVINSKPPDDGDAPGGAIGGMDLTITPANLTLVNEAMVTAGEAPILLEPVPPAEWRSETEIGSSYEALDRLAPRVSRAIDTLLARVSADGNRISNRIGAEPAPAAPAPRFPVLPLLGVGAIGLTILAVVRDDHRASREKW